MAWTGAGTIGDPYQITTVDELIETTGSQSHYYYKIMNDLDLSAYNPWITLTNSAAGFWVGSIDGNYKTINNLILTTGSMVSSGPPVFYDYIGLFGYLNLESTESPYIKNLNIDSSNLTIHNFNSNETFIGILSARVGARLIENIKITNLSASIIIQNSDNTSFNIGAFFADSFETNIVTCSFLYSTASLSGISDVISALRFSAFGSTDAVSTHSFNYVKDCHLHSDIVNTSLAPYSGTYVSPMYSTISALVHDCYVFNTTITSSNYVNGFSEIAGTNQSISNIYSSANFGNTNINNIFPFLYDDSGGTITVTNCYYESGSYTFNNIPITTGLTGLTNTEMQMSESFVGFDFENIWGIV